MSMFSRAALRSARRLFVLAAWDESLWPDGFLLELAELIDKYTPRKEYRSLLCGSRFRPVRRLRARWFVR